MSTTLSFTERYDELSDDLDLPDWQIAKKMGITLDSLERQLQRYERPVSELLSTMAHEERSRARSRTAATKAVA
jgi:hypothetical protein